MEDELTIYEQKPLTAKAIRSQVNLIQEVMKGVMQENEHYGVIPGCKKPSLWKPGAEKLITTFRLVPEPIVEDLSKNDSIRYRVVCKLYTFSQVFVGAGVGECSSDEDKYKWREVNSPKEWEATLEYHKRIKYTRDREIRQVKTNPSDLANTILKMAKKRAMVDAVLTVTGASDIFTQDIEDLPEEYIEKPKPEKNQPEEKSKTKNFDFLKKMSEAKKALGDKLYYEILTGKYTYMHSNEVTDEDQQMEIYNDMKTAYKEKAKNGI